MEARLFGLTSKELRLLAYQLAEKNKIKHPFAKENDQEGLDWMYNFMKRHPNLSIRKPEATSAARASGFNPTAAGKFYTLGTDIILLFITDFFKKNTITVVYSNTFFASLASIYYIIKIFVLDS